ncbi:MAG: hypothetical protein HWE34_04175 [Methylocystaceae bacterium]|nr:hypothetical protein [Methylocystaceae bacterium]
MTDTNTEKKPSVKVKRAKHASAQASYMERKRAEGKEWLATWVPGEAKESLKELAKRADEDDRSPSEDYVSAVESALDTTIPKWARKNQTLLNIWLISHNDILVDFGQHKEKSKGKKKKKKKKS